VAVFRAIARRGNVAPELEAALLEALLPDRPGSHAQRAAHGPTAITAHTGLYGGPDVLDAAQRAARARKSSSWVICALVRATGSR
jgi:hypothetical protein